MPYHKNKQQAFQAAQQAKEDAEELYYELNRNSGTYGHELKHLKQEVNEAYQSIENAHEVASEHQRKQLEKFKKDIKPIVDEINQNE
ncbi:hypothetical protein [Bacillus sp. 03113]|uniref:hypothetical protein n=1 Tax=Bacillus sp. 03113 TaxID=2578211 RepID=UPI0011427341|nr:hypothetical protein [Bacillus sp. 03113]